MLNRIAAYSLFILGFLTFTFFRHYSGQIIPYPWVFFALGLIMFVAGYLLLRYSLSSKDKATRSQLQQLINELKTGGEKITIDFKDCEIRGQSYTGERSPNATDSLLVTLTTPRLNNFMNYIDYPRGDGMISVQQSVIVFNYNNLLSGQSEKFISPAIPKDQVSLSFYLDKQKQTTLYVDKTDRNLYHFDLDFLNA